MCPWNVILMHPLISNFTFTNISWCKWRRKLQLFGNIKLSIMPKWLTLYVCEKLEYYSNVYNVCGFLLKSVYVRCSDTGSVASIDNNPWNITSFIQHLQEQAICELRSHDQWLKQDEQIIDDIKIVKRNWVDPGKTLCAEVTWPPLDLVNF